MLHQSVGRSQRNKGSKAKKILQVVVLFAVTIWLIYQIKHSYGRKTGYDETEYNKLRKEGADINFGRKVNAGSHRGINLNPQERNYDGTALGEGQADIEGKAEEAAPNKEHDDSQEDVKNSGIEEAPQEQQNEGDDNVDLHNTGGDEVTDKGASEGTDEILKLPSQDNESSFDQNENKNGVDDSLDIANRDNGESTKIYEDNSLSSTNQTEIGGNAGEGSDPDEIDHKDSDNVVPVIEEYSNSSVSADESNTEISVGSKYQKGETLESQEGTSSDTKTTGNHAVEEATANQSLDGEVVSSSLSDKQNNEVQSQRDEESEDGVTEHLSTDTVTSRNSSESENTSDSTGENVVMPYNNGVPRREDVESHVDSASEVEITDNSATEEATAETNSEGQNSSFGSSTEENNIAMPDSNGAPKREEAESQVDMASEASVTGNNLIGAATTETSSDGGIATLPTSTEENSTVMPDSNGAPKKEEVESNVGSASESETADDSFSDKGKAVTTNKTKEEEHDSNSNAEVANSSIADEHKELPASNEEVKVEVVESQGDNPSEVVDSGDKSLEGEKAETTTNEASNSSQSDEENSPDGEAVESQGGGAFKDTKPQSESNDVTSSDLGESTDLSVGNGSEEIAQKGSTDSELSASEEELKGLKKSAEL